MAATAKLSLARVTLTARQIALATKSIKPSSKGLEKLALLLSCRASANGRRFLISARPRFSKTSSIFRISCKTVAIQDFLNYPGNVDVLRFPGRERRQHHSAMARRPAVQSSRQDQHPAPVHGCDTGLAGAVRKFFNQLAIAGGASNRLCRESVSTNWFLWTGKTGIYPRTRHHREEEVTHKTLGGGRC